MTLWTAKYNATSRTGPYKSYQPDLLTRGRGFTSTKPSGITGALSQPAEYLARYAWKHYGGTQKTRALGLLAQKEFNTRYFRWRMYNYGNAKKTRKAKKFQFKSKNATWKNSES